MLSNRHFYFRLRRKYIVLFGNLFNNITLVRQAADSTAEIQRIKVPIIFGPKEKWVTRLQNDPDLYREIGMILPRMSYEIKGQNYDASRQQNPLLRQAKGDSASKVSSQYMGVPYDFTFELSIYARTIDDGNQIVEQILPYFPPDFTVTAEPIAELGFLKDTPIILKSAVEDIQYEGDEEAVRYVNWTLEFTVKGYYFGPITTPKIIRKVFANIWNDPSLVRGHVIKMNLDSGNNGNFLEEDTVFYGDRLNSAKAFGYVNHWNPETGVLTVGGAQGDFKANTTIRAASSNATYRIESFDVTPLKLVEIKIEPDPIDAQPDDDFGYTTTIKEWPETEE
jgi:hypothetical protein